MSLNGCNCYYNTGVTCSGEIRPCDKCGWNPEVEKARKNRLFAKKKGPVIRYEVKPPEEIRRTWIVKWVD